MSEQQITAKMYELITDMNVRLVRMEERLANIPMCGTNCANNSLGEITRRIDRIEKIIWGVIAFFAISFGTAFVKLVL